MSLKVHHLNCGTLCPFSQALFNGKGSLKEPGELICHCLLIETPQGLVLVDTGLGKNDVERRSSSLLLDLLSPPRYELRETAWEQILALGFDPKDVRHIILTHLDLDHAGGLLDFPNARVHLHRQEYRSAKSPNFIEQFRYLPSQWQHHVKWQSYEPLGEKWFGFEAVRPLVGLSEDILLIPLPGHTRGHSGIAIKTEKGWLLHCGDAYFDHRQLKPPIPYCPPGLMLTQVLESSNHLSWSYNLIRLTWLKNTHPEIHIFCAHDPHEFKSYTSSKTT